MSSSEIAFYWALFTPFAWGLTPLLVVAALGFVAPPARKDRHWHPVCGALQWLDRASIALLGNRAAYATELVNGVLHGLPVAGFLWMVRVPHAVSAAVGTAFAATWMLGVGGFRVRKYLARQAQV
jgi:hypothetical protein